MTKNFIQKVAVCYGSYEWKLEKTIRGSFCYDFRPLEIFNQEQAIASDCPQLVSIIVYSSHWSKHENIRSLAFWAMIEQSVYDFGDGHWKDFFHYHKGDIEEILDMSIEDVIASVKAYLRHGGESFKEIVDHINKIGNDYHMAYEEYDKDNINNDEDDEDDVIIQRAIFTNYLPDYNTFTGFYIERDNRCLYAYELRPYDWVISNTGNPFESAPIYRSWDIQDIIFCMVDNLVDKWETAVSISYYDMDPNIIDMIDDCLYWHLGM